MPCHQFHVYQAREHVELVWFTSCDSSWHLPAFPFNCGMKMKLSAFLQPWSSVPPQFSMGLATHVHFSGLISETNLWCYHFVFRVDLLVWPNRSTTFTSKLSRLTRRKKRSDPWENMNWEPFPRDLRYVVASVHFHPCLPQRNGEKERFTVGVSFCCHLGKVFD